MRLSESPVILSLNREYEYEFRKYVTIFKVLPIFYTVERPGNGS